MSFTDLHFIMLLLKPTVGHFVACSAVNLHFIMLLLKPLVTALGPGLIVFTFHYASIKTR